MNNYQAHKQEQQHRKKMYLKTFEQDMGNKVKTWTDLFEKYKKNQTISREEVRFLLDEIAFTYSPSLSQTVPYLQGHNQRIKEKFIHDYGISFIQMVLIDYLKAENFIMNQELGVFGRKKVIDSCIDKARETLDATEKEATVVDIYMKGEYLFEDKWQKDERQFEILDHQYTISRPYIDKNYQWMLSHSRKSIEEQVETGKLFFLHHMDRLEKEQRVAERIHNYHTVFQAFHQALYTIATQPIPLLDTGQHLERMKDHLRKARKDHASAFQRVEGYLRAEMK